MTKLPHPVVSQLLAELERQGKSHLTCASYRRALAHFVRWSEQSYGQLFDPAAIIPRDVVFFTAVTYHRLPVSQTWPCRPLPSNGVWHCRRS